MGRVKEFDPDAALRSALDLFWRKGYAATSMQDLVDHLGINRGSIYATFGDKHQLYLSAVDRYREDNEGELLRLLGQPGPVLPAVGDLVRRYARTALEDLDRKGCLMTNTAVERLPEDTGAGRRVEASLAALETGIAGALVRAQAQGELAAGKDPYSLARFLVTVLQGLKVIAKTPEPRRYLDATVEQALALLD